MIDQYIPRNPLKFNVEAVAPLFEQGVFPPYLRTGQDMADLRRMLMDIKSIDMLWFPHFTRCMEPIRKAGVRLLWYCDGNLNDMLPRLLDIDFHGFQGFQYEDGTPDDVRNELIWLVENGLRTGLFLSVSSLVAPGVLWKNIAALV